MPTADKNNNQKTCFVIMPFGGLWDHYYAKVYGPAIKQAELLPVWADDVFQAGSILQDIVDKLSQASVVFADIGESNRNVHYELGLSHALGKPTVLVAPKGMQLFFDIGQERMLTYEKENPDWGQELREKIARALKETMAKPETAIPTAFMHIKPTRLETDEVTILLRRIEERIADLGSQGQNFKPMFKSSLQHKLTSLPEAELEAQKLVVRMTPEKAVEQLILLGFRRAMAESAVATASSQPGGFTT